MRAQLPIDHGWLHEVMENEGYFGDEDGLCAGISAMAIQAYLCGEMEQFHNRLIRLHKTLEKEEDADLAKDWDAQAFLQGVELHQNNRLHIQTLGPSNSEAARAFHATAPSKLSDASGNSQISQAFNFSGIYNLKELKQLLTQLASVIDTTSTPLTALRIRNHDHVLMLGYNTSSKRWMHCVTPRLDDRNEYSSDELAVILANGLSKCVDRKAEDFAATHSNCFSAQVFCPQAHQTALTDALTTWRSSTGYKQLHNAAAKKNSTDCDDVNWLYMASLSHDHHSVSACLNAGHNTNLSSEFPPLHAACTYPNLAIVKQLLEHKADPCMLDSYDRTPRECCNNHTMLSNGLAKLEYRYMLQAIKLNNLGRAISIYDSSSLQYKIHAQMHSSLLLQCVAHGIRTDYTALKRQFPQDFRLTPTQARVIQQQATRHALLDAVNPLLEVVKPIASTAHAATGHGSTFNPHGKRGATAATTAAAKSHDDRSKCRRVGPKG